MNEKTYAEDFFEKFPTAPRFDDERPIMCRYYLYPTKLNADGRCNGGINSEGCHACWNEHMEQKGDRK